MSGLRQAPDRDAANAAPSNRPPTHMTIENLTEDPGTQPGLQYKHRPATDAGASVLLGPLGRHGVASL